MVKKNDNVVPNVPHVRRAAVLGFNKHHNFLRETLKTRRILLFGEKTR